MIVKSPKLTLSPLPRISGLLQSLWHVSSFTVAAIPACLAGRRQHKQSTKDTGDSGNFSACRTRVRLASPINVEQTRQVLIDHPIADYRKHGFGRDAYVLKRTNEALGFAA
jgi:hypothetical protein